MDKNGKLFGKVSVIDLLAICLILIVAAGTIYKFSYSGVNVNGDKKTIVYTLNVNGVRSFTFKHYEVGFKCYDKKTGEYIGKIIAIREEPFKELIDKIDGTFELVDKPNYSSIYLDIETTGTETDTAYFSNGTFEIKAGSEINLVTKKVDVLTVVENISSN